MEYIEIAEGFKGEKAIVTPYNVRKYQDLNDITKQLYVTHIGYYPNAKYHFRQRQTGVNENILIYCEKGKGWIECKDEKYMLSENHAFIIPANESHMYGADSRNPWSIYWIHFKGENVRMFNSIIGKHLVIRESDNSRYNDRIALFENMYQNLEMGYNPENLEYISFCLMHFLASLKYLTQFREIKNVKVDDVVQQCIHYMKDNLENKISLKDIADAVGYSNSHLTTLFTHRTSFSPIVYYNQLKIQRACSFLQFSDMKIKEIAFRLGYYDPFHFSNSFIRQMGITPKEYRKKYKEKLTKE
jgi:AraC-like DNA-binding protein/mannose-6-phosphate isomerase-like protein (cupin superfamily)